MKSNNVRLRSCRRNANSENLIDRKVKTEQRHKFGYDKFLLMVIHPSNVEKKKMRLC